MPQLKIFKQKEILHEKIFLGDLNIALKDNLVWWACDDEDHSKWETDSKTATHPPSEASAKTMLQVWLSKTEKYAFRLINWEWDILLDKKKCETGLYDYVPVCWNEVALMYQDYKFLLEFSESEVEKGDTNNLPKPVIGREDIDPKVFYG